MKRIDRMTLLRGCACAAACLLAVLAWPSRVVENRQARMRRAADRDGGA
jgi:hypothetical protein